MNNLQILADYLQQDVVRSHFYLGTYRSYRSTNGWPTDEKLVSGECGTTACALGWACAIPELQVQGLSFSSSTGTPAVDGKSAGRFGRELEDLATFFGVTVREIRWLFYPADYQYGCDTSIDEVIARMRHILAGGSINSYPL